MSQSSAASLPVDLELRYLEVLVKVGEILGTALDWHQTVHSVCDAIVDTVADLCFLHLKDPNGDLQLVAAASGLPELKEQLNEIDRVLRGPLRRTPFARQVFDGGLPVCIPEVDEAFLESIAVSAAHERFMRHMNYRSIIAVPLETKTQGILGEWRDVWIGAAVTSFLFVVGQFLLGWYLGRAGVSSGYGAFGSLVVFLIWVNYSAQIVLFGAEVTQVYAKRYGSQVQTRTTRGEIPLQTRTPV